MSFSRWKFTCIAWGALALGLSAFAGIVGERIQVSGTVTQLEESRMVIHTVSGSATVPRPKPSQGAPTIKVGDAVMVELSLEELLMLNDKRAQASQARD